MAQRLLLIVLALFTTQLLGARVPKDRKGPALEDSYWESDAETGVGKMYIWLGKDGKMNHRYSNTTYTSCSWTLNGNEFYFQLNNKYYWYNGTIDGNQITGGAQNVANGNWKYNFNRLDKAPEGFIVNPDAAPNPGGRGKGQ